MDTQTITIQGGQFQIPMPFSEGHTLNGPEASAMNQLFAENIRNNFAGKMKKAEEAKEAVPGQGRTRHLLPGIQVRREGDLGSEARSGGGRGPSSGQDRHHGSSQGQGLQAEGRA